MAAAMASPVLVRSSAVCSSTTSSSSASSSPTGTTRALDTIFFSPSSAAFKRCTVVARTAQKSVATESYLRAGLVRAQAGEVGTAPETVEAPVSRVVSGKCFVVGDNIDTDQIIPAEYLTLVPSKPEEYEKLGSYAMIGLPARWGKFIKEGEMKTEYKVVIGGANFGCGSSREHAPVAMGAAGSRAVVAESYARIFFRNSVATGELYPVETEGVIWTEFTTGDEVTVDMEKDVVTNHTTKLEYKLKPIGEAGPVIDAGGIFNYARQTEMIKAAP